MSQVQNSDIKNQIKAQSSTNKEAKQKRDTMEQIKEMYEEQFRVTDTLSKAIGFLEVFLEEHHNNDFCQLENTIKELYELREAEHEKNRRIKL